MVRLKTPAARKARSCGHLDPSRAPRRALRAVERRVERRRHRCERGHPTRHALIARAQQPDDSDREEQAADDRFGELIAALRRA